MVAIEKHDHILTVPKFGVEITPSYLELFVRPFPAQNAKIKTYCATFVYELYDTESSDSQSKQI